MCHATTVEVLAMLVASVWLQTWIKEFPQVMVSIQGMMHN